MGICNNFARLLYSKVKTENNGLPFHCIHPDSVIEDTTTLMIDMTQILYSSCSKNLDAFHFKTIHYSSPLEFLRSNDPVGHIEFDKKTGHITNFIEQFTMKTVVSLLIQKIMSLWKKWSFESRARGIDCKLKYIFLVLDGDSPPAKSHTRSKRISRSHITSLTKNFKSWMEYNKCMPKDFNSLTQNLRVRFYKFEWTMFPNNYLLGSIQRFLQMKDWKRNIIEHLIDSFKSVNIQNCSAYLAVGNTQDTQIKELTNLMSTECDEFLPSKIPYKEADVIIPYLWSFVSKHQEGSVCILSNDSDMIVTLFALGDPRMKILTKVGAPRQIGKKGWNFRKRDKMSFMGNMTAFAVSPDIKDIPRQRLLDLLLHLTMGGCDYVESFPKCGPVTILRGIDYFIDRHESRWWTPIFHVVKFLKCRDLSKYMKDIFCDEETDDIISIPVDDFALNEQTVKIAKKILYSVPNTFPIRILDKIYVVQLVENDISNAIYWYHCQCKSSRRPKKKLCVSNESFISSIRRRLFYLSIMCDTRLDMESVITYSKTFSLRCGYDKDKSFDYINSINAVY